MSPGAWVNATASIMARRAAGVARSGKAVLRAVSTTGTICCICARLASSGTTPPYFSCTDWLAIWFDNIFPSTQTDAEVSSQEDSIARIVGME